MLSTQARGGSYAKRSFLRTGFGLSTADRVLYAFGRGSGSADFRVVLHDVMQDRVQQELAVGKAVVDVCAFGVNGVEYLALLAETEVVLYAWGE